MSSILDELAEHAKERTQAQKRLRPAAVVRKEAETLPKAAGRFESALKAALPGIAFICECKKASPSKGVIAEDFPYLRIAKEYEKAGASCLSVLTEPEWFLGSDAYLKEITSEVSIPVLRKDFTVDDYMIYDAKTMGASAVLLICALLSPDQLREYLDAASSVGLDAVVEVHDEAEMQMAADVGASIIGVNNRNLKDFTVDLGNSIRLRETAPEGTVFVAESGITGPGDIRALKSTGVHAALVGEALMRAQDKTAALRELRAAYDED